MATNDQPKLGIGFIGMGTAFQMMMPNWVAHPLIKIVAGADTRPDGRAKFGSEFGARTYENIGELASDPEVDIVYIATPHQFHAGQIIAAVQHGKNVVVEKPLALTLEDCQAVVDAVEKAGVKVIIGHTNSYDPPILKMRQIIESGELGDVRLIHTFNYTEFLYRTRRPEELDTSKGGGIIFNQVPHQVDMARLLGGGLVRSVRSMTGIWDPTRPTEGSHASFLEFESGAAAILIYSGYAHFNADEYKGRTPNLERYGVSRRAIRSIDSREAEGQMVAEHGFGGPSQTWNVPTAANQVPPAKEHETFGEMLVSCERGDMRGTTTGIVVYSDDEIREIDLPFGRGNTQRSGVIDEIYDAIVLDKPLLHDVRWGMATIEVCLAILQSSREHKEILLKHQVPLNRPV
ncbi:MAG TPA: Gfo/Idh/MocA family oxidoreductase [Dehalococcoidia bacterium]|nr:Gfo/Idh/MocA family oxidoreductase [Dehalococcoidia bacterium]